MRKRRRKIKLEMGKLGLPDVFGKTVFDEFLVLVLVKAHEDGEIAGFGARFEVEHHRVALLRFDAHGKKERGAVRVPRPVLSSTQIKIRGGGLLLLFESLCKS